VKESQDFKREVMEKGVPAKKEITFETELFGFKTFLIYVEPVFSKAGETIGVNYMGMEITDQVKIIILNFLKVLNCSIVLVKRIFIISKKWQVRKREKMAKLREEIAVQKAKETELNKTIHITGLINQAKSNI